IEIEAIPVPEIAGDKVSSYLSGSLLMDLIPSDQEEAIGIQVKELSNNSIAKRVGFEQGDIIFAVNRSRIRNIAELKSYLRQRNVQAFRIRRGYEDLILYVR
ncbi:PDZ domain-containing protein, partial [Oleiphilus sp. HI0123]